MASRYGQKAKQKVARARHERKKGTLKSGRSGKRVTSRKQAIAIGLSEARKAGQHAEYASAVRAHDHGRAKDHLAGMRGGCGVDLRLPCPSDVDAPRPKGGNAGLGAADDSGCLVVGRIEAGRVDRGRGRLKPDAGRIPRRRKGLADHARRIHARAHHLGKVALVIPTIHRAACEIDNRVRILQFGGPWPGAC